MVQLASPRWVQIAAAICDLPLPGGPAMAIAIRSRVEPSVAIFSAISLVRVACVSASRWRVDNGKINSSNVISSPKM